MHERQAAGSQPLGLGIQRRGQARVRCGRSEQIRLDAQLPKLIGGGKLLDRGRIVGRMPVDRSQYPARGCGVPPFDLAA